MCLLLVQSPDIMTVIFFSGCTSYVSEHSTNYRESICVKFDEMIQQYAEVYHPEFLQLGRKKNVHYSYGLLEEEEGDIEEGGLASTRLGSP